MSELRRSIQEIETLRCKLTKVMISASNTAVKQLMVDETKCDARVQLVGMYAITNILRSDVRIPIVSLWWVTTEHAQCRMLGFLEELMMEDPESYETAWFVEK
jgi:hypothetical protein